MRSGSSREVERVLEQLRGSVIPDDVQVRITRNYGETANDKVNNLVEGLGMAIVTVIGLIALVMNWRVGLIVATAVPITYALTLLVNFLLGYTINRVTLFALILALGLLVDDPIVGVENIYRHLGMKKLPRLEAILVAMNEVLPPIVIATLAIVVAFIPMFFITGMMGPYMRPMAMNVPLAMLSSMLVSLAITPWMSNKLLERGRRGTRRVRRPKTTPTYRVYRRVMLPFVESRKKAWAAARRHGRPLRVLAPAGGDRPRAAEDAAVRQQERVPARRGHAGTATLERTDAVVRELEDYLRTHAGGHGLHVHRRRRLARWTSTAWSATTTCGRARTWPTSASTSCTGSDRAMDSHAIALRIRHDIEAHRRKDRREDQDRRDAARPAGARHRRRRDLRPAAPPLRRADRRRREPSKQRDGARRRASWTWTTWSRRTSRRCSSAWTARRPG